MAFNLGLNRFDDAIDIVVNGDDAPAESVTVEPFAPQVVDAQAICRDAPPAHAIRVTPTPHDLGGYGAWWWSAWSGSFAL